MREVLDALLAAPPYVNRAIKLAAELMEAETRGDNETIERLSRSVEIEYAINDGNLEGGRVLRALQACGHAPPCASKTVPVGF